VKNLLDALDALMDDTQDSLGGNHLHVDELVNWINRPHILLGDLSVLVQLRLEDVLPKLADWSELL
jgi:hypothetical protein